MEGQDPDAVPLCQFPQLQPVADFKVDPAFLRGAQIEGPHLADLADSAPGERFQVILQQTQVGKYRLLAAADRFHRQNGVDSPEIVEFPAMFRQRDNADTTSRLRKFQLVKADGKGTAYPESAAGKFGPATAGLPPVVVPDQVGRLVSGGETGERNAALRVRPDQIIARHAPAVQQSAYSQQQD